MPAELDNSQDSIVQEVLSAASRKSLALVVGIISNSCPTVEPLLVDLLQLQNEAGDDWLASLDVVFVENGDALHQATTGEYVCRLSDNFQLRADVLLVNEHVILHAVCCAVHIHVNALHAHAPRSNQMLNDLT